MLEWSKLLCPVRRKSLYGKQESVKTGVGRKEIERDYDRILFAAPTRRLANKTQVFPMEENIAIRTRLTHSHEVSNLARSIGVRIAFEHPKEVFGSDHESLEVKRNIPSLLAAVGLAHDLGNPPFGHQGEIAIQQWFSALKENEKIEIHGDFLNFDGNAQTLRLLTRLQVLNDEYGLNLTFATLSGLLKYPSLFESENRGGFQKFGIFKSEEDIAKDIWKHCGLDEGVRHPLAYIMEACDDIAYSVIDAEDTVKKGYASFYDLMDYLESSAQGDVVVCDVIKRARDKNAEFKKESLSSKELNDISMQMFRVIAIARMIVAATDIFVSKIYEMLKLNIPQGYELIENSECSELCILLKKFDRRHGFHHSDVLKLELEGNNYIKALMSMLWQSINTHEDSRTPFERYAYGGISENYRRVYERSSKDLYNKYQLLCDALSGMTEQYLVKVHDELKILKNGAT